MKKQITELIKKKKAQTPLFLIQAAKVYYEIEAHRTGKTSDEIRQEIHHNILTQLFNDAHLKVKVSGMCYRNYINYNTLIHEDVYQQVFYQLSRYRKEEIFIAYCDKYSRLIGLFTTIAKGDGFRKMKKYTSPNQSIAKQILHTANFNKSNYINTSTGTLNYLEGEGEELKLIDEGLDNVTQYWNLIRENLNDEEKEFLQFILDNIYDKRKIKYDKKLRENFMGLTEYKINFLMLQNRIREIIKQNKLIL